MKNKLLLTLGLLSFAINYSFCMDGKEFERAAEEVKKARQAYLKEIAWFFDTSLVLKKLFSLEQRLALKEKIQGESLFGLQETYNLMVMTHQTVAESLVGTRNHAFKLSWRAGIAGAIIASCIASYYWVAKKDSRRKKVLKVVGAALNGALISAVLSYTAIVAYWNLKILKAPSQA